MDASNRPPAIHGQELSFFLHEGKHSVLHIIGEGSHTSMGTKKLVGPIIPNNQQILSGEKYKAFVW